MSENEITMADNADEPTLGQAAKIFGLAAVRSTKKGAAKVAPAAKKVGNGTVKGAKVVGTVAVPAVIGGTGNVLTFAGNGLKGVAAFMAKGNTDSDGQPKPTFNEKMLARAQAIMASIEDEAIVADVEITQDSEGEVSITAAEYDTQL